MNKILIIDNDSLSASITDAYLPYSFDTRRCSTIAAALCIMQTFSPDLIILEAWMDGEDVFSFCEKMKDAGIPFLFVTFDGAERTKRKCMKAGASGILIKPYQSKDLLRTVRGVLEKDVLS